MVGGCQGLMWERKVRSYYSVETDSFKKAKKFLELSGGDDCTTR